MADKKKSLKVYADLKVRIREYEDEDGNTKGAYVKVGTLFASPHLSHMFITLEAMPISKDWDGAVSVFKREDAEQSIENNLKKDVDL